MSGRLEKIDFLTPSSFFHRVLVGELDGTTNEFQNLNAGFTTIAHSVDQADVGAEPKFNEAANMPNLDSMTRVMIYAVREPGIGTFVPTYNIRIQRGGEGSVGQMQTGVTPILLPGAAKPVIFPNLIPDNFMKLGATATASDLLAIEAFCAPGPASSGSTDAHVISLTVFLLPSWSGKGGVGRGNILSGSGYY